MSQIKGMSELQDKLRKIADGGRLVGAAALNAGMGTIGTAIKSASPGTVSQEVGRRRVSGDDTKIRGKVGLSVGRIASKRPHGQFLSLGTRFIQATHFVRRAIQSSLSAASANMQRAAKNRLAKLIKQ